jgi:hypothetical protein
MSGGNGEVVSAGQEVSCRVRRFVASVSLVVKTLRIVFFCAIADGDSISCLRDIATSGKEEV